jgi:HEAT repeat protein
MQNSCRDAIVLTALIVATLEPASAQTRDGKTAPLSKPDLSTLGRGWTALAAGRTDDAIKAADQLLAEYPGHHSALDLKIEALVTRDPVVALDAYEGWLVRARIEDVFLLAPIARATLERIAAGDDRTLALQAFQRLAASGDSNAKAQLLGKASPAPDLDDVQLAMAGDADAATRLIQSPGAPGVRPQTLAKAIAAAGPAAVPMLRSMLKHTDGPVRIEAVMALGKIRASDAIPDLKPLLADPQLRSFAAVALARVGDAEGEAIVQELLRSPLNDMRLLAAQAYEGKGSGPWVQALMPALEDPNGLTRIRAAELLAPVAPEAALPTLLAASKDPNPVVRSDVMRVFETTGLLVQPTQQAAASPEKTPSNSLAALRQQLRDPDAAIRLHAAGTVFALVRTR